MAPWPEVEDDVSLCVWVRKVAGVELTLEVTTSFRKLVERELNRFPKVMIYVGGGCVQSVMSNDPRVRVVLVDQDDIDAEGGTRRRRRRGPEGEFLRGAGVDKQWVTSSGYMTCVSPGGKLLGRAPSAEVLEEFRKLPASERGPGAVKVPDLKPDERLIPSPPERGPVLKVHARFLGRDDRGGNCATRSRTTSRSWATRPSRKPPGACSSSRTPNTCG